MSRRSLLVPTCVLVLGGAALAGAQGLPTAPPGAVVPDPIPFDVVVVGSGTGGTAAAVQAARLGSRVALLERTDGIGGQMVEAGVTSIDSFRFDFRSGIFGEFLDGLTLAYTDAAGQVRPLGTCYWSAQSTCFEPHVGRGVLKSLLGNESPDLVFYPGTRVVSVDSEIDPITGRTKVTGVQAVRNGQPYHFTAAVVVDATETAYVLGLGPARYRAGNHTSDDLDPAACVDSVTYATTVRRYPTGVPAGLRLQSPPGTGYAAYAAQLEQLVGPNGGDCVPGSPCPPESWRHHNAYRGMPDSGNPDYYTADPPPSNWDRISKTGINAFNDVPMTVADLFPANEAAASCRAKVKTAQFVYYMQRNGQRDWSVANDEGFATPWNVGENNCSEIANDTFEQNMTLFPYYRESLRLVGLHTLTAAEIFREPYAPGKYRARTHFKSSVALGDYAVDLHGCVDDDDLEAALGESYCDLPDTNPNDACSGPGNTTCGVCRFGYFVGGPFQIPFESFVPETVDGLLAGDKNISVSRLAGGAARLQPSTVLIGQAAGAIAGLSVRHGVPPRDVPPVLVQAALVRPAASGHVPASVSIYQYQDVPRTNPHWAGVQIASSHEILVGNGIDTFSVGATTDRAVGAVGTAAIAQLPLLPCTGTFFADVPTSHYACKQIEALAREGYTAGCGGGNYCPGNPHTRQEEAVFLVRATNEQDEPYSSTPHFVDVPNSHPLFKWIQLAYERGLMSGYQGTPLFAPTQPSNRGEYADDLASALTSEALRQVAP